MTEMQNLLELMQRLRDAERGCPWDRAQNYASLVPHTLEEAYEVAEAIAQQDWRELCAELGDLLFQIVFYAQIAAEEGRFEFADVVHGIVKKMTRRHPHVFGNAHYANHAAQMADWERIKAAENAENNAQERRGILDDVPLALPALTRAVKLQKRAAQVGFDWETLPPVLAKVEEELAELRHEIELHGARQRVADEVGDVLFALANVARHLRLDPETALRGTNQRFTQRFRYIEQCLAAQGRKAEDADLEELETLWQRAKAQERIMPD